LLRDRHASVPQRLAIDRPGSAGDRLVHLERTVRADPESERRVTQYMPGTRNGGMLVGPGAASADTVRLPGADQHWNPDDHLVQPETRQEMVRGELIEAMPARPGHGDTHSRLDAVVSLCVAPGYVVSTDLLTRRSADTDFATDTCVRRAGRDPATGGRYMEELSFEIFFTQSLGETRERARDVLGSGVRRMFGLFVAERYPDADIDGKVEITVREWSRDRDDWRALAQDAAIEDPCLRAPLPVRALVDAAAAEDAVARALIAKRNPVIEKLEADSQARGFRAGEERGLTQGLLEAQRRALHAVLDHRGIALDPAQARRIAGCDDLATLERWFARALTAPSADALLD
jgi:hypothetical protein